MGRLTFQGGPLGGSSIAIDGSDCTVAYDDESRSYVNAERTMHIRPKTDDVTTRGNDGDHSQG